MPRLGQVFVWLAEACALGTFLVYFGMWFDFDPLFWIGFFVLLPFWIFVYGFIIIAPVWFFISVCLFAFRQRAKRKINGSHDVKAAA